MLPRFHIKVLLSCHLHVVASTSFWLKFFMLLFPAKSWLFMNLRKISWLSFSFAIGNIACFCCLKSEQYTYKIIFKMWGEKITLWFVYCRHFYRLWNKHTWGVRYSVWSKPPVLLLFLQNTRQEAIVQSLCFKA